MKLGVNIDHVATLRQARKEDEPSLIDAARIAVEAGADGITIHLREDRRHIQDQDVYQIRNLAPRLNLEMATSANIVAIAKDVKPDFCCLVPEKREEITTEGGLNVKQHFNELKPVIKTLQASDIQVSLFIDPDPDQIQAAHQLGAEYIEIHTGSYANSQGNNQNVQLQLIKDMTQHAIQLGLKVNAGHGLKYHNVAPITQINGIEELNIGHSIISRSLFVGLRTAIMEMKRIITK